MHITTVNMNKLTKLLIIILIIVSPAIYKFLDYYVVTIDVHVPILGYVETGITKYDLEQFQVAKSEYDKQDKKIRASFIGGQISSQDYDDKMSKINMIKLSDPRITAVTGGPAKKVLSFMLDKI